MCSILQDDAARGDQGWYDDIHRLHLHVIERGEAAWTPDAQQQQREANR
jgi:hypothetical protein